MKGIWIHKSYLGFDKTLIPGLLTPYCRTPLNIIREKKIKISSTKSCSYMNMRLSL